MLTGDVELSATSEPVAIARPEGKHTIMSSLQHAFKASDHGKQLRCVTAGTWLTADDDSEAATRLDVMCTPFFIMSSYLFEKKRPLPLGSLSARRLFSPWLNAIVDDEFTFVDSTVAPLPKEPITLYGYGIGQTGDVVVNFTANPRPSNVYWQFDDDTRINVEPFSPSPISPRYVVEPLRDIEVRQAFHSFTHSIDSSQQN